MVSSLRYLGGLRLGLSRAKDAQVWLKIEVWHE